MATQIDDSVWVKVKRVAFLCISFLTLSLVFNVVQYVQTCRLNNKYNDLQKQHNDLLLFTKKLDEKITHLNSLAYYGKEKW